MFENKNNLIILIIIVIIVLVIILLTSPTCKNAVQGVLKRKTAGEKKGPGSSPQQVQAPKHPQLKKSEMGRGVAAQKHAAKEVKKPVVAGPLHHRQPRDLATDDLKRGAVDPREAAEGPLHHRQTRDLASDDLRRNPQGRGGKGGLKFHPNGREHSSLPDPLGDRENRRHRGAQERRGPRNSPNGTMKVAGSTVPAPVPSLSGPVENLFDPQVDLQGKFGVSDAQLTEMAKNYKKRHMTVTKPQVPRSRHVRRSEQEAAEDIMRQTYINANRATNQRDNSDEFVMDAMKQQILAQKRSGETPKRASRATSFKTKKRSK